MKVYLKKVVCSIIVLGSIFLIPIISNSKDYISYYDELFTNNEFTINTSKNIQNSNDLLTLIRMNDNNYSAQEYFNSPTDYSSLSLNTISCDYDEMTCSFGINRSKNENGNYTSSSIKNYENIKININSNVDSYFTMVNEENNVVINYDESMFTTEEEKNNYIIRYFNGLSYYDNDNQISTSYTYNVNDNSITRIDRDSNSFPKKIANKTINNIIFEYTEDSYSDDFKKLTDGTIIIKSDTDITREILSEYLSTFNYATINSSINFNIDGEIKNNKAFIKMIEYENGMSIEKEKHLVNIVRQPEIDIALFERYNLKDYIDIAASEQENDQRFIQNYLNSYNLWQDNNDGSTINYSLNLVNNTNDVIIKYLKKSSNQSVENIEFHKVTVRFTGYNDTFSEEYLREIGREIVVNSDIRDENSINETLGYSFKKSLLACNDDYSICDIGFKKEETDTSLEIHKVNIKYDNTITEEFKKAFNLNEDGSIDIIIDENISTNYMNYYSYYDNETNNNYSYDFMENDTCKLILKNYYKNKTETHKVIYNKIVSDKTQYYLNNVLNSINVYPGETTGVWSRLNYSTDFGKTNNSTQAINCNRETSTCDVILRNDNNILEIHKSKVNIKDGMSEEFKKAFQDNKVEINGVYIDNEDYLYAVSSAYLMGRTKSWSYLEEYANNKGKIYYNGIESHTLDVSFANANEEHREIINNAIRKLDENPLKIKVIDLGFINSFYYSSEEDSGFESFNSKQLNDDFYKIIKDKHIGYFYLPRAGMDEDFVSMCEGNLLLYYDGISYGQTNRSVNHTQYNIIYIPDDTENTKEAFIKAAQKRVDDYLGKNSGVIISYKGPNNLGNIDIGIDITGNDGNAYYITHGTKEEEILIIKDSSKMQDASFIASDVYNNVIVSSDNANYPSNTIVSSNRINSQSDIYKKILEKLKVKYAEIIDIDLYSASVGDIKEFNGINFEVTLPLKNNKLNLNNLYAYYIDDNGNIEEHPVTVEDFMAQFNTTHFSTYIISEKIDSDTIKQATTEIKELVGNPQTYDKGIKSYIIIGIISIIGLIAIVTIRKKINN